jgi:hypothetical protein
MENWVVSDVPRELCDQCIAAHNGKPLGPIQAIVRTVRKMEHYDVVISGILMVKFRDKHPRQWTKRATIMF